MLLQFILIFHVVLEISFSSQRTLRGRQDRFMYGRRTVPKPTVVRSITTPSEDCCPLIQPLHLYATRAHYFRIGVEHGARVEKRRGCLTDGQAATRKSCNMLDSNVVKVLA